MASGSRTSPESSRERFKIGTAGWSYEDWKGAFYPSPPPRGFKALPYYARHFDMVEVNSTFYAVAPPSSAEKWCRDVAGNPRFSFTAKLWRGLTHDRPDSLPEREVAAIKSFCGVLAEAGRLDALLLQFPWSFRYTPDNLAYLDRLLEAFGEFPQAVEVRHSGWNSEDFFSFLRERGVAFCNIDQPALRDCLALSSVATAPFSYLRLHGRNAANWFSESANVAERYDYLYSPGEVETLAQTARLLAAQTDRVIVTSNNHFRGQAAANSLMLEASLKGECRRVPACLAATYPELSEIPAAHAAEPDAGVQPDLFG